jgi:hypothetical protein
LCKRAVATDGDDVVGLQTRQAQRHTVHTGVAVIGLAYIGGGSGQGFLVHRQRPHNDQVVVEVGAGLGDIAGPDAVIAGLEQAGRAGLGRYRSQGKDGRAARAVIYREVVAAVGSNAGQIHLATGACIGSRVPILAAGDAESRCGAIDGIGDVVGAYQQAIGWDDGVVTICKAYRVVGRRHTGGHDHAGVSARCLGCAIAAAVGQAGNVENRRGFAIDETTVGNTVVAGVVGLRHKLGIRIGRHGERCAGNAGRAVDPAKAVVARIGAANADRAHQNAVGAGHVGRVEHRRTGDVDRVARYDADQAGMASGAHGHAGAPVVGLGHARAAGQGNRLGSDVGRGGRLGAAQFVIAGQPEVGAVGQAVADGGDRLAIGFGLVAKAGCAVVQHQCFGVHAGADAAPVGDVDRCSAVIDLVACSQARDSQRLGCDSSAGCHTGSTQGVVGGGCNTSDAANSQTADGDQAGNACVLAVIHPWWCGSAWHRCHPRPVPRSCRLV